MSEPVVVLAYVPLSPRANKFKFGRNGERTVNANLWAAGYVHLSSNLLPRPLPAIFRESVGLNEGVTHHIADKTRPDQTALK